jgi:hypothetical protein
MAPCENISKGASARLVKSKLSPEYTHKDVGLERSQSTSKLMVVWILQPTQTWEEFCTIRQEMPNEPTDFDFTQLTIDAATTTNAGQFRCYFEQQ